MLLFFFSLVVSYASGTSSIPFIIGLCSSRGFSFFVIVLYKVVTTAAERRDTEINTSGIKVSQTDFIRKKQSIYTIDRE
jgi:hypothetical protein